MKDYKELGMSIKSLRGDVPANQIAKKLGMSRNNLSEIESGKRVASGEKLRAILNEIGYDFEITVFKIKLKND